MKQIRKRLTYANVMSSIAVFLLVGGGAAFAATQLPKNSVGTKQIKKNAVNGSKVKNGSLTGADINLSALGTVPSAATANHAASADNATHATNADAATNASNLPSVLASGQTLRGDVSDATDAPEAGTISSQNVSFPIPLASTPTVHIIRGTEAPPAGCSGNAENPNASPGNLCIFIKEIEGPAGTFLTINPENVIASQPAAGRFGFFIYNNSTAAGRDQWWGSWVVTG